MRGCDRLRGCGQLRLRYSRIVIGATTAVSSAEATSTQATWPPIAVPAISPRMAVTRWLTGLTPTQACRNGGMVAGSAKMLLAKVSGIRISIEVPITASGERSTSPRAVREDPAEREREHQQEAHGEQDAGDAPSGAEPEGEPEADGDRRGDRVADRVAQQRVDDRRRPPRLQRPEAVEDTLGDVGVDREPGVDGDHEDRLHEDPGQQVLQVGPRVPGDDTRRRGT